MQVQTVIIVGLLIKKYIAPTRQKTVAEISVGDKLSLSDMDWMKNGQTLLFVLQKGCHFCTESAPFYQRLMREMAGRSSLHLVALLPNTVDESKQYLNDLGIFH